MNKNPIQNMKKTYIIPNEEAFALNTKKMLAGSAPKDPTPPINEMGDGEQLVNEERHFGSSSVWDTQW